MPRLHSEVTTPSTSGTDVAVRHSDEFDSTCLLYTFRGKGHRDKALEFARRVDVLAEAPSTWTDGALTGAELVSRYAALTLEFMAPSARGEMFFAAEILEASRHLEAP